MLVSEGEACIRGCYRCLLSYFNQPDHELIDRTKDEAKQMLIDLARGRVVIAAAAGQPSDGGAWANAFKEAGLPSPDASPVSFCGQEMTFVWRRHFVAACPAPLSKAAREAAEAKGWTLFELPSAEAEGVPDAMIALLREAT
jgi:hypothetical protein